VENAKSDAVVGKRLLAKMYDETSYLSSEAEWKALEDDGQSFQKWQENDRNAMPPSIISLQIPLGSARLKH